LRSVVSSGWLTFPILPFPCNVGKPEQPRVKGERDVEVRIGIVQTMKELEIELDDDVKRDTVIADIEAALTEESVLWLTDRKGRRVGVPAGKIAYVEVGAPASDRRVGFGTP